MKSNNFSDVGIYEVKIKANLVDYTDVDAATSLFTLTVLHPCLATKILP
jgi:hypothetical protein